MAHEKKTPLPPSGCPSPGWTLRLVGQVCYLHDLQWCGQAYPSWSLPQQFSWRHWSHLMCFSVVLYLWKKGTRMIVTKALIGGDEHLLLPVWGGLQGGAAHRVKSVISIMIMHICLASTMMSLPLSSHLDTSASSLLFSSWKLATCSAIFAFCSWGSWAMIAWNQKHRKLLHKENMKFSQCINQEYFHQAIYDIGTMML